MGSLSCTPKLEVGDTIQNLNEESRQVKMNGGISNYGKCGKVVRIDTYSSTPVEVRYDDGCRGLGKEWNYTLVKKNNKFSMTNIIEKIKLLTKSEPDKSAIKAGLRNTSDEFTCDGKEAFIEYLYQKNKADFDTTIVQPILKDEANNK